MPEHVGELARRRPGVDRDHGAAEEDDREIGEDPLGPVAHEEADLVAPAHAERIEALGEPAYLIAQRPIAEPRLAADQRLMVGIARRKLVEQVRNGFRVGRLHVADVAKGGSPENSPHAGAGEPSRLAL